MAKMEAIPEISPARLNWRLEPFSASFLNSPKKAGKKFTNL